jgi:hypothetical protein
MNINATPSSWLDDDAEDNHNPDISCSTVDGKFLFLRSINQQEHQSLVQKSAENPELSI